MNRVARSWPTMVRQPYHHETKNLLVSYSPKRPGFFQATEKGI